MFKRSREVIFFAIRLHRAKYLRTDTIGRQIAFRACQSDKLLFNMRRHQRASSSRSNLECWRTPKFANSQGVSYASQSVFGNEVVIMPLLLLYHSGVAVVIAAFSMFPAVLEIPKMT